MLTAEPPAVVEPAASAPAASTVMFQATRSEVLISEDTRLPLIKAGKTEDGLLRQTIALTSVTSVVRSNIEPYEHSLRWTYKAYLQRQMCFVSITGLFTCAVGVSEELTDKSDGEGPLAMTPDDLSESSSPAAEVAWRTLTTGLSAKVSSLFANDRRVSVDPMLAAAGVSIRRPTKPATPARK